MTRGKKPTRKPTPRAGATDTKSASSGSRPARPGGPRRPNPPRKDAPQLDAPPASAKFRDRDGEVHTFPESALKRLAAQILQERRKVWRYRPFSFPLFTPSGTEQAMYFDFYVYDNMDSVVRLILVTPRESRDVWDRIGRFKQQYPTYSYELWTPDALARLSNPRARLGF
ncbi:hypothetical protein [Deinococcus sonorensis]|uniref:Uncharacterized protein n=2 Tax=Deinococcus sonorensis TaxID=309891 RepID=A0AAU7U9C0_9DEIO